MELKHSLLYMMANIYEFYSYLYGIETYIAQLRGLLKWGFTRTFMELKHLKHWIKGTQKLVLLVPLWNWNPVLVQNLLLEASFYSYLYGIETGLLFFNSDKVFVLLVPLWNWNADVNIISPKVISFTRTFMELKLRCIDSDGNTTGFYSYLYGIETISFLGLGAFCQSFTRTFMELKHRSLLRPAPRAWRFTRTFMELKHFICEVLYIAITQFYSYLYGIETSVLHNRPIQCRVLLVPLWNWNTGSQFVLMTSQCFTRTFMELKLAAVTCYAITRLVLLVPLWNWNFVPLTHTVKSFLFYSYLYGIETRLIIFALNKEL